jgi:hypothetical protein
MAALEPEAGVTQPGDIHCIKYSTAEARGSNPGSALF